MSAAEYAERSEREDEYEGSVEREAAENAQRVREILAPVLALAERAMAEIIALKVVDRFQPGFENACGWQPGKIFSDDDLQAAVYSDVRAAFTPWLKPEVRDLCDGA